MKSYTVVTLALLLASFCSPVLAQTTVQDVSPPGSLTPDVGASSKEALTLVGERAFCVSHNLATGVTSVNKFNLSTPGTFAILSSGQGDSFAGDFGTNGFWYAIAAAGNNLVRIDTTTGMFDLIGPCPPVAGLWSSLEVDPTTGTAYGTSTDYASTSYLYTINLNTGTPTLIGAISGAPVIVSSAFSNGGQLYAVEQSLDNLVTVNKVTGSATVIGPIGFDALHSQDAAFDRTTNTLYLAAYTSGGPAELRTANLTTGNTTLIAAFPSAEEVTNLVIKRSPPAASAWTPQTSGITNSLSSVYFSDANNGWAVGNGGKILHTASRGSVWTPQSSGTSVSLSSVYFIDANNGWVVGDSGTILHTASGGATWTSQASGTTKYLRGVCFPDANTGTAVGGNYGPFGGIILHTTNGGITWVAQINGTFWAYYGVSFTDANNGWAVGNDFNGLPTGRNIIHTTNGGSVWTTQSSGSGALSSVNFMDANNGWAVGGDYPTGGAILRTTDGGNVWTPQSVGTPNWLQSVHFVDASKGWAVGGDYFANSTILHTTNGGGSWTAQSSGTTNSLGSVYFTDANTGWAVGYLGTILHTSNGGVTFAEEPRSGAVPSQYSLEQNYPNPFNPSTVIRFQVPSSKFVMLKVYDILGREVRTLVNEELKAGSYETTFDASGLASGIFFYRLVVGGFTETKKLMLLR
jgi:photosystem II stability/assembly factor-like uncharacterized protein